MHFKWRLPVSARICKEAEICQSYSCKNKPEKLRINNFCWMHQRTEVTDHHSSNICRASYIQRDAAEIYLSETETETPGGRNELEYLNSNVFDLPEAKSGQAGEKNTLGLHI